MRPGRWKCLGVVGATLPLWIPGFAGMTMALRGPHNEDENGATGEFFPSSGGLTPPHPFWIPAFAGMTNGGPVWRRDAANGE